MQCSVADSLLCVPVSGNRRAVLPTCVKLAVMLLTKRTYTCLGGGLAAKSVQATAL